MEAETLRHVSSSRRARCRLMPASQPLDSLTLAVTRIWACQLRALPMAALLVVFKFQNLPRLPSLPLPERLWGAPPCLHCPSSLRPPPLFSVRRGRPLAGLEADPLTRQQAWTALFPRTRSKPVGRESCHPVGSAPPLRRRPVEEVETLRHVPSSRRAWCWSMPASHPLVSLTLAVRRTWAYQLRVLPMAALLLVFKFQNLPRLPSLPLPERLWGVPPCLHGPSPGRPPPLFAVRRGRPLASLEVGPLARQRAWAMLSPRMPPRCLLATRPPQ